MHIKTGGLRSLNLVDLHTHSTASDGTLTPSQLVTAAKEQGLKAIALTDHDTITGLEEALAKGREVDLEVIPGVEISVDHAGGELHLLGYFLDLSCPQLHDTLARLQSYREERNPQMIAKLQAKGFDITMEEVKAMAGGKVVGRPHMAAVLVAKGYVVNMTEAFNKYLASGCPAYVEKQRLSPEEGINLVLQAKGIPVLAHPKYLPEKNLPDLEALVVRLKGLGLKGIEVHYTSHGRAEQEAYGQLADQYQLVVTGGTDFHGANKPDIQLGIGMGTLRVPYSIVEKMKETISNS